MTNDDADKSERSPMDVLQFALGSLGFFIAIGGIAVSSVAVCFCGSLLMAVSLVYFLLNASNPW